MPKHVSQMRVALTLQLGEHEHRVSDASINFALNSLPNATVGVAVGQEARSLEKAIIHETAGDLRMMVPATLRLFAKGDWGPGDTAKQREDGGRWLRATKDGAVVFRGYLAGTGFRQQRGALQYTISLIHWLADLSFSSALSNQSHPANPARFRWRATFGEMGESTVDRAHFVRSFVAAALFAPLLIQQDLWGSSLAPFLCQLTKQDVLDEIAGDACVGLGGDNTLSQRALARFERRLTEKDEVGEDCETGSGSPYHVPLDMDIGSIEHIMAESIGQFVGEDTVDGYFSSTVWDRLVGRLAPALAFSIVPKIETAMVVPFVPGLRSSWVKQLDAADLVHMDHSAVAQRPLRAVGVLQGGAGSRNGAMEGTPLRELGGCFAPLAGAEGMIRYVAPPPWLAAAPYHAHSMARSALPPSPTSSTTPRTLRTLDSVGDATGLTPAAAANAMRDYYAAAAQQIYAQEMLRGRTAVLQGKLRFDIAPGCNVAIRGRSPLFLDDPDDPARLLPDWFATVVRVGCAIDAERASAGTAFQLEHLRSYAENTVDSTSVARHPLYKSFFTGSPLAHDLLFPE